VPSTGVQRLVSRLAAQLQPGRDSLRRLAELFVLTGFTITQPLLDVTGRAPDVFVFRRAGRLDIVLFAVIVTALPPLLLWAVEQFAGLAADVLRRGVHLLFVSVLLAVLTIEISKKLFPDRGYSLLLVALVVGAVAAALLARSVILRTFVRYLTPAPVVFVLLFLVASPVAALVRGVAAPAAPQAHAARARETPPIVVIFFDEFPTQFLVNEDGVVDPHAFPNFARLQRDSTWFRHATTNTGWTSYAVPSMLTGRYPQRRAPSYHSYKDTLFTLLSADYAIEASETVSQLCPPTVCPRQAVERETGLLPILRESVTVTRSIFTPLKTDFNPEDQFVEHQGDIDPAQLKFSKPGQVNQPTRFTDFVASLRPSARPTLRFLHILLPHTPFRFLPSGATYGGLGRSFYDEDPVPGAPPTGAQLAYRQRMLLQIAYLDTLMGQVISQLEKQGLYDDALIAVTADHGMGFTRGTSRPLDRNLDDGRTNAPEIAYVPMFLKTPRQQAGRIDDRNWEHVDLLPTLADVLDVDLPWRVDGFSGLGPDRRPGDEKRWYNSPGKPMAFSMRQTAPGMLSGVVSRYAEPQKGPAGLFEYGPNRDLITKQVSAIAAGPPVVATAIANLGRTVRADPNAVAQPALVFGRVTGLGVGTPIAVAINGTIAAVPSTFSPKEGGEVRFAGVVSDRAYRKGSNTVRLFVVERLGGNTVLRPLPHTRR
jgi:hypothetical protein